MDPFKSVGEIVLYNPSILTYKWILNNFVTIDKTVGSFVTSPMIPTENPAMKLRVALYPNGEKRENEGYLEMRTQLFGDKELSSDIPAFVKFFLTNYQTGAPVFEKYYQGTFKLVPVKESYNRSLPDSYECNRFVKRDFILDKKNNVTSGNQFRIYCETVFYDKHVNSIHNEINRNIHRLDEFSSFKKLLEDDQFSDFTLIVQGKKIQVHKAILANRSPVFQAMVTSEMQEKKQNTAEIVDIEYEVMKQMVQYIYTVDVDDIKNMAKDLLVAADKYCVAGLKDLCGKTLAEDLNHDNVLERLVLADTYNSASLKMQALQYIKDNPEIVDKEEFAALCSTLMCDVTRFALKKFKS